MMFVLSLSYVHDKNVISSNTYLCVDSRLLNLTSVYLTLKSHISELVKNMEKSIGGCKSSRCIIDIFFVCKNNLSRA